MRVADLGATVVVGSGLVIVFLFAVEMCSTDQPPTPISHPSAHTMSVEQVANGTTRYENEEVVCYFRGGLACRWK